MDNNSNKTTALTTAKQDEILKSIDRIFDATNDFAKLTRVAPDVFRAICDALTDYVNSFPTEDSPFEFVGRLWASGDYAIQFCGIDGWKISPAMDS